MRPPREPSLGVAWSSLTTSGCYGHETRLRRTRVLGSGGPRVDSITSTLRLVVLGLREKQEGKGIHLVTIDTVIP